MKKFNIWDCKILVPINSELPGGFEAPPRTAAIDAIEISNATPTSWRFMNGRIEHPRYAAAVNTAIDNIEFINVVFEDTTFVINIDANVDRIRFSGCSFGTQSGTNTIYGNATDVDSLIITDCVATATITNIVSITGTFSMCHHNGNEWAGNVTKLFLAAPTLAIVGGDEIAGGVHRGSGAPSHSAALGTIYQRLDGATNTLLYVNDDGSTSWAAYA